MPDPAIAVNLLWCVPGDVGGSEEYLVRQLLGLAEAESHLRPTLYVVDGFVEAHPTVDRTVPNGRGFVQWRVGGLRRVAGEATWFRQRSRALPTCVTTAEALRRLGPSVRTC